MDALSLKAEFVRNGMTQAEVAKAIGMSSSTFGRRLRSGVFGINEAERLIEVLNIQNPGRIFFTNNKT